jgi:hypothetical protein
VLGSGRTSASRSIAPEKSGPQNAASFISAAQPVTPIAIKITVANRIPDPLLGCAKSYFFRKFLFFFGSCFAKKKRDHKRRRAHRKGNDYIHQFKAPRNPIPANPAFIKIPDGVLLLIKLIVSAPAAQPWIGNVATIKPIASGMKDAHHVRLEGLKYFCFIFSPQIA